ncbi:MAG: T9SS type A sorting domain-containing protein, partial [Candidatus Neomarinimicrobiota bacterium]|nr:T9SS type A sorting domain-containing protein [Candidatus Neomarinimicrobiota bacterium]
MRQDLVYAWGWGTHRYINENAVDCLPPEMDFFQEHRNYLREHSTDPDVDDLPGYYHYIDIDYYPEFFEGTFPHDWDEAVEQYGYDVIIDNGTIPWVIETWTDSLTVLMASGQWEAVWQVAAELGHYVADSHQPLHLTLNYNGQLTGNYGIHSRYETHMINPHLSELPLPDSLGIYWISVIDSVFRYIGEIYPYASEIIDADDLAADQDPNYNSTYYNTLWDEVDSMTISVIHCAIVDLASIWQTAWVNSGDLNLPFNDEKSIPNVYLFDQNYPNPFNPVTTLHYGLPEDELVNITIYDMMGRQVSKLVSSQQTAGYKS